ncbi:MAG: hypothetical protein EBZ77_14610 [Chitinophagia bacterium]|nr:hypothetical protein [Chitinophagia bacterium]
MLEFRHHLFGDSRLAVGQLVAILRERGQLGHQHPQVAHDVHESIIQLVFATQFCAHQAEIVAWDVCVRVAIVEESRRGIGELGGQFLDVLEAQARPVVQSMCSKRRQVPNEDKCTVTVLVYHQVNSAPVATNKKKKKNNKFRKKPNT